MSKTYGKGSRGPEDKKAFAGAIAEASKPSKPRKNQRADRILKRIEQDEKAKREDVQVYHRLLGKVYWFFMRQFALTLLVTFVAVFLYDYLLPSANRGRLDSAVFSVIANFETPREQVINARYKLYLVVLLLFPAVFAGIRAVRKAHRVAAIAREVDAEEAAEQRAKNPLPNDPLGIRNDLH